MANKVICPICSNKMKYIFKKFGYNFYQCHNCKFGKFYPLPDKKKILRRYSDEYFSNEYLKSYGSTIDSANKILVNSRFDYIDKLLKNNYIMTQNKKKLLDIGCGGGFLLKNFSQKGWDVFGIDIISSSVRYVNEVLKLPAAQTNFEDYPKYEFENNFGKFDLITLTDALEHFFDPISVLEKIYYILKDNGILFLNVPNVKSISFKFIGKEWAIISPLEHISYFSATSLKILLEEIGFKNVNISILQYVNLANVHKRSIRYYTARVLIYLITRLYSIGFEGKEFYDEILRGNYFKEENDIKYMGDVIIATGQRKNGR